jgi:hypothetical protein
VLHAARLLRPAQVLLDAQVNLQARDASRMTPYLLACQSGCAEVRQRTAE